MKKLILPLLFIVMTLPAFSMFPTVMVSYHKNCLLCAVSDTKSLYSVTVDGVTTTYWARSVNCTSGWNSCPENKNAIPAFTNDMDWCGTVSVDLWEYAINQIGGGDDSGTEVVNVYNPNLNLTIPFEVTWNHSGDNMDITVSADFDSAY